MELQPDKQPVVVKDIQRNFLDKGKETKSKLNILDKLKEIDNGPTR
jgi:hypothetical protein